MVVAQAVEALPEGLSTISTIANVGLWRPGSVLGEAEVIALASGRGARLIADDLEARHVAETVDVDHVGTAGVLLEAHMRLRFTFGELEAALRDLCEVLWFSPAVVADILTVARETDS